MTVTATAPTTLSQRNSMGVNVALDAEVRRREPTPGSAAGVTMWLVKVITGSRRAGGAVRRGSGGTTCRDGRHPPWPVCQRSGAAGWPPASPRAVSDTIRVSPQAAEQIRAAHDWWRINRTKARHSRLLAYSPWDASAPTGRPQSAVTSVSRTRAVLSCQPPQYPRRARMSYRPGRRMRTSI